MLTDYTTYDDIRSALGVTADEVDDQVLALETWDNHLSFELEDVSSALVATYAGVASVVESGRTPAQAKLYRATRLFSTLAVANALTASLPMFGPKSISDGKAVVSRFADSPYKPVVARVEKQFETAKKRLKDALAELNASSAAFTPRTYLSSAGLGVDPVTG